MFHKFVAIHSEHDTPYDHVCAIRMKVRDPIYYNSDVRRRNTTLLSDLLFIAFFLLLQKLVGAKRQKQTEGHSMTLPLRGPPWP